jgi:hypothetical protein
MTFVLNQLPGIMVGIVIGTFGTLVLIPRVDARYWRKLK